MLIELIDPRDREILATWDPDKERDETEIIKKLRTLLRDADKFGLTIQIQTHDMDIDPEKPEEKKPGDPVIVEEDTSQDEASDFKCVDCGQSHVQDGESQESDDEDVSDLSDSREDQDEVNDVHDDKRELEEDPGWMVKKTAFRGPNPVIQMWKDMDGEDRRDLVTMALEKDDMTITELSETLFGEKVSSTDSVYQTLNNALNQCRKRGLVEQVGEKDDRYNRSIYGLVDQNKAYKSGELTVEEFESMPREDQDKKVLGIMDEHGPQTREELADKVFGDQGDEARAEVKKVVDRLRNNHLVVSDSEGGISYYRVKEKDDYMEGGGEEPVPDAQEMIDELPPEV